MPAVITDNLGLWTSALLAKSTAGRGNNVKLEAYGIKKLRGLILDLAMNGKLLVQNQNDEPDANILKKVKHLPLKMAEGLGQTPHGWVSAPLEALSADTKYPIGDGDHGQIKPACYTDSGIPYIRVADLGWGNFEPNGLVHIPEAVHEQNLKSELRPGDILIAKTGATIGKCCIIPDSIPRANTTSSVGKVTVNQDVVLPKWIICYFLSGGFKEKMWAVSKKTAQPGFNIADLKKFIVPVPPLAEQHRLVAKVDELMALCDQLEQQQTHSLEAHQTLAASLLGTLTHVDSQQEFSSAWARIASHFDTLFTTEASIDQLKQTILQLAFMGKLVPQDPNDEPASALLKRIAEAKEQLISEGGIKRQKTLPEISEEEKEYELPTNWKWCRFQDITRLITDGKHGDCNNLPNSGFYFLSAKDIQNGELLYENARQILPSEFEEVHQRTNLQPGDICMVNTGATVGKMAIATDNKLTYRTTFQKSVAVIKVATPFVDLRYIGNYLQAETPKLLHKSGGSAINNLLLGDLKNKLVPLPPRNEQIKIVAKVDELMKLCDSLKARLADAQAIQLHLADAIVEQAVC